MSDPDVPEGEGLVEVDAAPSIDDSDPPVRLTAVLLSWFSSGRADGILELIVTPESLPAWEADADHIAALLERDDPAAGHGSLVPGAERRLRATGEGPRLRTGLRSDADVMVSAIIVTLQHRPELEPPAPEWEAFGQWRVHGIGDYVLPEDLP